MDKRILGEVGLYVLCVLRCMLLLLGIVKLSAIFAFVALKLFDTAAHVVSGMGPGFSVWDLCFLFCAAFGEACEKRTGLLQNHLRIPPIILCPSA